MIQAIGKLLEVHFFFSDRETRARSLLLLLAFEAFSSSNFHLKNIIAVPSFSIKASVFFSTTTRKISISEDIL
ncbi:hypothetical protein Cni_G27689 [Canna indica]|uniref:Uncharacterized protein n=1 Tax=Canna indica TaxID=4628 RepID=A0AAQ3L484_9LILI|nr:hypothetical protein Cni_G27689 [Canna indica]